MCNSDDLLNVQIKVKHPNFYQMNAYFSISLCFIFAQLVVVYPNLHTILHNVSPARILDVVIYLDSITIVLDEAAKGGGPPLSFPIASIEPGEYYSLPNLPLSSVVGSL